MKTDILSEMQIARGRADAAHETLLEEMRKGDMADLQRMQKALDILEDALLIKLGGVASMKESLAMNMR